MKTSQRQPRSSSVSTAKLLVVNITLFTLGSFGYYLSTFAPALMLTSSLIVYFIIMTQMLYPMTLAVFAWMTGIDPSFHVEPTLYHYSTTYMALSIFIFLTIVCLNTDLGFFMKVSSAGVIFLLMLILFIIITGFQSGNNTDFVVGTAE